MDLKQLKQDYLDWEVKHTVFYPWSETVFEVENDLVDAYGRKPFVLVEEGGCRLNPGQSRVLSCVISG